MAVVPLAVRDGEGRLAVRKGQFLAAEGRDLRERRQFVFEGVGKAARASSVPCTSTLTPSDVLPTCPVSRSLVAARYTKGRKPTPWTCPPMI